MCRLPESETARSSRNSPSTSRARPHQGMRSKPDIYARPAVCDVMRSGGEKRNRITPIGGVLVTMPGKTIVSL